MTKRFFVWLCLLAATLTAFAILGVAGGAKAHDFWINNGGYVQPHASVHCERAKPAACSSRAAGAH